jgi:hypothetical protein
MKLTHFLENAQYLMQEADLYGKANEIRDLLKYDLNGTNSKRLMKDLEHIEKLLDVLERAYADMNNHLDAMEQLTSDSDYNDTGDND